uniref:Bardet-Biedl syndrome 5 protein homolog n=1 Tax=Macrostomum lignano TaxID=282301 RepID=A0A1I8JF34_9PLAT
MSRPYAMELLWQDREIRFDLELRLLNLRPGEKVVDRLDLVEDTKGNNGDKAIGYNCVLCITIKPTHSKQRGNVEALFVLTKFGQTRFEFIFTSLETGSPRLFSSVMAVHRSYESSRAYRDLKLRTAIIADKRLKLLPQEELLSEVTGVWNLSSDQGNLGTFCVTNVRLVWFATMNEAFNISVPYMQMKSVRIKDSKFGLALVVETIAQSGGYVLGFRIDPADKLKSVAQELQSLQRVYSSDPVLGVQFDRLPEEETRGLLVEQEQDDLEMDEGDEQKDVFAAYLSDGDKSVDREPVFSPELELAVESVKDGFTLQDLWAVLPDTKQKKPEQQQQQEEKEQQRWQEQQESEADPEPRQSQREELGESS